MNQHLVEILLVEDNLDDAELAIRELKRSHVGNNLFHVKDGEEALEFLFATGRYIERQNLSYLPKVILLDIQMPKVNGIEVLEKIRLDERTRYVPVVILTSSKEDPDIKRCYELGANSYIVKPVSFEGFAHAIKHIGYYWVLINQPPIA